MSIKPGDVVLIKDDPDTHPWCVSSMGINESGDKKATIDRFIRIVEFPHWERQSRSIFVSMLKKI